MLADRHVPSSPASAPPFSVRTCEEMLLNPNASEWLREALRTALMRDPVEAANDAETLRVLLLRRAAEVEESEESPTPAARTTCARRPAS